MYFTTREDYGIALMQYLAEHYSEGPVSLRDIAQSRHIPFLYLEKIAQKLKKAKLIASTRGAHGGYRLSRSPKSISIGDIICVFGEPSLVKCQSYDGGCPREHACTTKQVWLELQRTIQRKMNTISLKDIVAKATQRSTRKKR